MRPLRGLTWGGSAYVGAVIVVGATLVPVALFVFPLTSSSQVIALAYLGVLTQVAALMPINWRHGKQTVDTMPLVAASLLAPGVGPVLISWLCKNDGRWPSRDVPFARLAFNRARSAIEFGLPSMLLASLILPADLDVPAKTIFLALGQLLIGYPLTAKTIASYEREHFWKVVTANVGMSSVRSVFILAVGGGALFVVLQHPAGYVMGLGLLTLLVAVRSNMADAQRQQVERIQTLELLAQALDARDPMTELHSQRVANLAAQLGQALTLSSLEVERIRVAGLLHDIGKIGVPDSILKKPQPLDAEEWVAMRRHAEIGADMIARHSALAPLAPWVRHHHERWNGSGYPSRLEGQHIPIGARILAVADSFDTITGPRVYRRSSLPAEEAVADISRGAGVLYDPIIVNALRRLFDISPIPTTDVPPKAETTTPIVTLLLNNARLRLLALGMAISALGDPLTTVAVTLTSFAVTHNGLGVALALILRGAAMMATGLVLGGATDRLRRRPLIVGSDLVQFGVLVTLPLVLRVSPLAVFAAVVVLGVASALSQAARDAAVASVVPPEHLAAANGTVAVATMVTRTAGYPIAAAIIWWGVQTSPLYVLDAITFLIAGLITVTAGSLGGGTLTSSITGAFQSTISVRHLRPALIVACVGAFIIFATQPAVIVLAHQVSNDGTRTYTLLEVVLTLGMLLGGLGFGLLTWSPRRATLIGLALMGVLSVAAGMSVIPVVTAAALFVASVGNQFYFLGNRTDLQRRAPAEGIGAAMATRGVLVQTMAMLGGAAGGYLSSVAGGRAVYVLAGMAFVLLGGGYWLVGHGRRHQGQEQSGESVTFALSPQVEIPDSA